MSRSLFRMLCCLAWILAAAFPLNAEHVLESPKEIPVA